MTWSSSARVWQGWRRRSTAHRKGCGRLVIEDEAPGGQAGSSSRIENYLGFPEGVSGADSGAAGAYPGHTLWGGIADPESYRDPHGEQLQHCAIGGWPGSLVSRLPDRCWRQLPPLDDAGRGAPDRGGGLLWGGDDRGQGLQRTRMSTSSGAQTRPARRPCTSPSTPDR